MAKPIVRYYRAAVLPADKWMSPPFPDIRAHIKHGEESIESLTVHVVTDMTLGRHGHPIRFETKHKIYVEVRE